MTIHSDIGASSADRWMNCPASVRLSKGMPNTSSKAAEEGRAAHTLIEVCLKTGTTPSEYRGKFIDQKDDIHDEYEGPGYYEVTDNMIEATNIWLAFVEKLKSQHDLKPEHFFIEKGFHLKSIDEGAFGTSDLGLYVPQRYLHIIDYKHGRGKVVEAEDNPQIMYYGLGMIEELCPDEFDIPSDIYLSIVQPRAYHKQGPIRTVKVSSHDLDIRFRKRLKDAIARTKDETEEPKIGSWCYFCRAKAICPAMRKKMSEHDFLDLTEEEMGMEIQKVKNGEKSIAEIMAVKDLAIQYLDAVEAYALHLVQQGEKVEGFRIGRKDTRWKITDPSAAMADIRKLGIPDEKFIKPPALIAIGQLEKYPQIKAAIQKYKERPLGAEVLVPDTEVPLGL